jgi:hypothetical protein
MQTMPAGTGINAEDSAGDGGACHGVDVTVKGSGLDWPLNGF